MLDATHPIGRLHSEALKRMLSAGWQSEKEILVEAFFAICFKRSPSLTNPPGRAVFARAKARL